MLPYQRPVRQLRGLWRTARDAVLGKSLDQATFNPYDRNLLQRRGELLAETLHALAPVGSVERGRQILKLIESSFPTVRLSEAYFQNLRILLDNRSMVEGRLMLGLGTGRCGSTTLAALLASAQETCVTHENPPLLFWKPEGEQLQFHLKRLLALIERFPFVCDVAHWWLNVVDSVVDQFPDVRIIGLIRDTRACANSFMRIKGYGARSINHWARYGNGLWLTHRWDPTYPSYELPDARSKNLDELKYHQIVQYIRDYNAKLEALAIQRPRQILLVRTEDLSQVETQTAIFSFAGVMGRFSKARLNMFNVDDGLEETYRF